MARPHTDPHTGQIKPPVDNGRQISPLARREADLKKLLPVFKQALPQHLNPDRMLRVALTALRATPKLVQTTPASFFGALVASAQLGLEVNTPLQHAFLVPYEDKKNDVVICQLIVGYMGYIDLAYRSGRVLNIRADAVKQGDVFEYELGLEPKLIHKPTGVDRDAEKFSGEKLTHVYGVARLKDADPVFLVMSRALVERYRARSRARSSSSPWQTDFEEMAKKTVIRQLRKWIPQSPEMAHAAALDERAELGRSQLPALPPEVLDGLLSEGLIDPSQLDTEGEEVVDPTTGVVTPAPAAVVAQAPQTTQPTPTTPSAREPGED